MAAMNYLNKLSIQTIYLSIYLKDPHTIRKRVGLEVPSVVAVLCAVWGGKMLGIFA